VIVLIDATTLASMAIALPGGTLATIFAAWRQGRFLVVVSEHLLVELRRTLSNAYFSDRLSPQDRRVYLAFIEGAARHTEVTVEVSGVATHPEDDVILASALSGGADYLVTSDRRFRVRVSEYQGVRLVSPTEFLSLLSAGGHQSS